MTGAALPRTYDLSDLDHFWTLPMAERHGAFRDLREHDPVRHFESGRLGYLAKDNGYWAVTRYADIIRVTKDTDAFTSSFGATSVVDLPPSLRKFFGAMMNADGAEHLDQRKTVSKLFTPSALRTQRDLINRTVHSAMADLGRHLRVDGTCDFVDVVASRIPLAVVCEIMGVPLSEADFVLERTNRAVGTGDPEIVSSRSKALTTLINISREFDELLSDLLSSYQSGRIEIADHAVLARLSSESVSGHLDTSDLTALFMLLLIAGNETTRNAISWGLVALTDFPDQRRAWMAGGPAASPSAIEEILRWSSPLVQMRRTVIRDVELAGQQLKPGDKVLLFYGSGNRDEAVYDNPDAFDITRDGPPHLAFGGFGIHYCLGAHLARLELEQVFNSLLVEYPDLRYVGTLHRLRSNFISGIKSLSCRVDERGVPGSGPRCTNTRFS